jgi:hypothetical protein
MKSGNLNFLEPSWPLQTCNGTVLPLPILSWQYSDEDAGWKNRGSNPGSAKWFFSSPRLSRLALGLGQSSRLLNGYRDCFPGVKRPGCETDHSLPSNVNAKNEQSYAPTSPIFMAYTQSLPFYYLDKRSSKLDRLVTFLDLYSRGRATGFES